MKRRGGPPVAVFGGPPSRWRRLVGETLADIATDAAPFVGMVAAAAAVAFGLVWLTGGFEGTPAQRAGFPDPPPACERGEAPRRVYLSNGTHVMTCAVQP